MNRQKSFIIIFFFISLFVLGFILWNNFQIYRSVNQEDVVQLEKMWHSGDIQGVADFTSEQLKKNSLSFSYLRYRAYADFYLGLSELEQSKRRNLFTSVIYDLRKALVLSKEEGAVLGEMYYILGKAYYYQSFTSLPLAIKSLQKSIEYKYESSDTYEFLADAYQQLGEAEKSLYYFESFDSNQVSDHFLLAYAKSLISATQYKKAQVILERAEKITQNQLLLAEILLQLAQVYYNTQDYNQALEVLEKVIQQQDSAPARFLLGEIYSALGQPVQARREWRRTLSLDNQFTEAYRRLQE